MLRGGVGSRLVRAAPYMLTVRLWWPVASAATVEKETGKRRAVKAQERGGRAPDRTSTAQQSSTTRPLTDTSLLAPMRRGDGDQRADTHPQRHKPHPKWAAGVQRRVLKGDSALRIRDRRSEPQFESAMSLLLAHMVGREDTHTSTHKRQWACVSRRPRPLQQTVRQRVQRAQRLAQSHLGTPQDRNCSNKGRGQT